MHSPSLKQTPTLEHNYRANEISTGLETQSNEQVLPRLKKQSLQCRPWQRWPCLYSFIQEHLQLTLSERCQVTQCDAYCMCDSMQEYLIICIHCVSHLGSYLWSTDCVVCSVPLGVHSSLQCVSSIPFPEFKWSEIAGRHRSSIIYPGTMGTPAQNNAAASGISVSTRRLCFYHTGTCGQGSHQGPRFQHGYLNAQGWQTL